MKKIIGVLAITLVFSLLAIGCSKQELEQTKAELEKTKAESAQTKAELGKTKTELAQTNVESVQTKAELEKTKTELAQTNAELQKIKTELAQKISGPGKYKVTLVKKNLTDLDWNKSTFGSPLNIKMTIYKDGIEVCKCAIDGKRGEQSGKGYRNLAGVNAIDEVNPLEFDIEYSPTSKYVIKWEELAVIASTNSYTWGEDAQGGNWPFNGRLSFKQSSWLEFSAKKIQ